MRLTIIKDDNAVYVDGIMMNVDCTNLPENFHALQWNGSSGWVEFTGVPKPPNEEISDVSPYQSYVDQHAAAKLVYDEMMRKQAEEQRTQTIPNQPYPSWTLNAETNKWEPPVPKPTDGGFYRWNETQMAWVLA